MKNYGMFAAVDAYNMADDLKKFIIWNREDLPERLIECLEDIRTATRGPRRDLLIQQAIGYAVACIDFENIETETCEKLIDILHSAH